MPAAIRPRRRSTGCATRSAPTIEFDAGARGPAPTMMSVDTPLPERLDAALRSRLGDGWLLGEDARRRHGEESSKRWALPAAVALPRDVDDVVAIVRASREHRVPTVGREVGRASGRERGVRSGVKAGGAVGLRKQK